MSKKKYAILTRKNREYRLYQEDIKMIYKRIKKVTPPLPPCNPEDKYTKLDQTTQIGVESLERTKIQFSG